MATDQIKKGILSGAAILAVSSFLSRILGMLRDRVIAAKFGTSADIDAYFAAFRVPDFIYNLVIVGAFSTAFVPIFTAFLAKNSHQEAFRVVNTIINLTLIVLFVILGLVFFLVPSLSFLLGNFSVDQKKLTIDLTRILLLSPLFFGLSNVFSGVLNSYKKFFVYSLAPIIYNLGIIGGAFFLAERFGIYGVAYGVVVGALGHFLIQVPSVFKLGYRYRLTIKIEEGVKKIGILMLPRIVGLGMTQLNLLFTTIIASYLASGSITIYNFANNLQSFPLGIFGISFAFSIFPFLAETAAKNDFVNFKDHLAKTFGRIVYFLLPLTALMWLLREQIVRLILGSGYFTWEATRNTAETLGYFTFSLLASALIALLARAFYALQNTKTPVVISVFCMVVNISLSLFLGHKIGVIGLALAFSISTILQFVILFFALRQEINGFISAKLQQRILKLFLFSLLILILGKTGLYLTNLLLDLKTFLGVFLETALVIMIGAGLYFVLTLYFKDPEAIYVIKYLNNFKKNKLK